MRESFEQTPEQEPSGERLPTNHYTYVDYGAPDHPVIFECDAMDILEADEKFKEKLKKIPERENNIGCSVVKN